MNSISLEALIQKSKLRMEREQKREQIREEVRTYLRSEGIPESKIPELLKVIEDQCFDTFTLADDMLDNKTRSYVVAAGLHYEDEFYYRLRTKFYPHRYHVLVKFIKRFAVLKQEHMDQWMS